MQAPEKTRHKLRASQVHCRLQCLLRMRGLAPFVPAASREYSQLALHAEDRLATLEREIAAKLWDDLAAALVSKARAEAALYFWCFGCSRMCLLADTPQKCRLRLTCVDCHRSKELQTRSRRTQEQEYLTALKLSGQTFARRHCGLRDDVHRAWTVKDDLSRLLLRPFLSECPGGMDARHHLEFVDPALPPVPANMRLVLGAKKRADRAAAPM